MLTFCTLFDSNYLDKGWALYRSLERCSKDFVLYIFCFDEQAYDILKQINLGSAILVPYTSIETDELLEIKKTRSKAEYCWTCTPVIIEYVLEHYSVSSCTYIDSDLYFFHNPEILFEEIVENEANIVLTEHRFADDRRGKKWLRRSGKYCVEFNYFDQSDYARTALKWWKEQCFAWCYALYEADRMGDQKYLERFPALFKGVHELQNLGGGVAPWNLYQYSLVEADRELMLRERSTNKVFPLIFYHFQNIRYLSEWKVNINSETHDKKLKRRIYYPYLKEISELRDILCTEYGLDFKIKKSCSSNKIKSFIQSNIMQFKVKSLSDIINLNKIENY